MAGFMYAYNLQLKQQIIRGETSVNMPLDLMNYILQKCLMLEGEL
jgi:hypothetical protein